MWQYQVNSKKIDINLVESIIKQNKNAIVNLPLGSAKYISLPNIGDEVFLVTLKNARLHGYVIDINDYGHTVCFFKTCLIPMITKRRNWTKIH